jgi:hypothetical protein
VDVDWYVEDDQDQGTACSWTRGKAALNGISETTIAGSFKVAPADIQAGPAPSGREKEVVV